MSMTDIVSSMNMHVFPTIGLVCFGVAFTIVLGSVLKRSGEACDRQARIPFEDQETEANHG
jgi:hypothetical protein